VIQFYDSPQKRRYLLLIVYKKEETASIYVLNK